MSRGLRNRNPGNIRKSTVEYIGEIQSKDSAFKQFKDMAHGYRAMFVLLHTYQKKYEINTIRGIINRYAPPEDNNDTEAYIKAVSKESCIAPDTKCTFTFKELMIPIVSAMSRVENGVPAVQSEVEEGWKLFVKYLVK